MFFRKTCERWGAHFIGWWDFLGRVIVLLKRVHAEELYVGFSTCTCVFSQNVWTVRSLPHWLIFSTHPGLVTDELAYKRGDRSSPNLLKTDSSNNQSFAYSTQALGSSAFTWSRGTLQLCLAVWTFIGITLAVFLVIFNISSLTSLFYCILYSLYKNYIEIRLFLPYIQYFLYFSIYWTRISLFHLNPSFVFRSRPKCWN